MNTSAPLMDDTELVARSLAGNREAFGQIVERYQATICGLAYSATGSVSRSEDLAQETFVAAWRQLAELREPGKLRSWLCGIARNLINAERRRLGREPAHQADRLVETDGLTGGEPAPSAQAVSAEEQALLWREVGGLPANYREVLVLYYREEQSVANVAASLELSEEAVMQRLSRGRRLLHERMLAFVEEALVRTKPGQSFRLGVQAALPVASQGAGLAASKGLALKGGGLWAFALPLAGMFAALGLSWHGVRTAPNAEERRFARRWHTALWVSIGALLLALRGTAAVGERRRWGLESMLEASTAIWFGYLVVLASLMVLLYRRAEAGFRENTKGGPPATRRITLEILASYLASTGWIIGLAWLLGDRAISLLVTGATIALAAWHLGELKIRSGWAAQRLSFVCNAGLCLGLLVLVNLRLEHWLAPLYGVSVADMGRALDLPLIHLLSVVLIGWTAVLLAITARKPV